MSVEKYRRFEGPPELLFKGKLEKDINERRGMPGYKSPADNLTKEYGERGIGWDMSKQAYLDENQVKDELHAPEFKLATEAFRNALWHGRYELDDGTDMRGKVQRYVREPDIVDVVIYPDGKAHAANLK